MAKFDIEINVNGEAKVKNLADSVDRLDSKSKTAATNSSTLGSTLTKLGVAAGAYIAIDRLARSLTDLGLAFIKTGGQFEDFAATLKTVEGSATKAKESLAWVQDFASTTPFNIDKVTQSFISLRAYGLDPTQGLLRTLGDTSAAMGKDLQAAVEAMADAVVGDNERLKEFGLRASIEGESIRYNWTDSSNRMKQVIVANNSQMIQSTLSAIFNEKYAGAMEERSKTWNGMLSNMEDKWTLFKASVMEAGLLDYLKALAEAAGNMLSEAFANSGNTANDFAKTAIEGIQGMIRGAGMAYDGFQAIADIFKVLKYSGESAFWGIASIATTIVAKIDEMWTNLVNFMIDGLNSIISLANSTGLISISYITPAQVNMKNFEADVYAKSQLESSNANLTAAYSDLASILSGNGAGSKYAEALITKTAITLKDVEARKLQESTATKGSSVGSYVDNSSIIRDMSQEAQDVLYAVQAYKELFSKEDLQAIIQTYSDNTDLTITLQQLIKDLDSTASETAGTIENVNGALTDTTKAGNSLSETINNNGDNITKLGDTIANTTTAATALEKALEGLAFQFSDTLLNAFKSSASALESIGKSASSLTSVSYSAALNAATQARAKLIANPLNIAAGEDFKVAYDTFVSSASSYLNPSNFQSGTQYKFAQASVATQTSMLEDTAVASFDVLTSMNELLTSINNAFADGLLTDAERADIKGVADSVNAKNELLLGEGSKIVTSSDAVTTKLGSIKYYDNTGLATDSNISAQKYYDNSGLALNTTVDELYKGSDINAKVNTITGFALDESLTGSTNSVTSALGSLDLTTDNSSVVTALTGTDNSVSSYVKALMGDKTKGIQLSSVVSSLPSLSVSTGLDVSKLSNIDSNTKYATANNTTSLKNLQVKKQTVSNIYNTYPVATGFDGWGNTIWGIKEGSLASSSTSYEYYAQGGFTGDGFGMPDSSGYKPAGVVHEGEWVAPEWMVESNKELFNSLESVRVKGAFSDGGTTGSSAFTDNGGSLSQGYLFAIADGMNKLNSMFRQVTSGGNAMIVEVM